MPGPDDRHGKVEFFNPGKCVVSRGDHAVYREHAHPGGFDLRRRGAHAPRRQRHEESIRSTAARRRPNADRTCLLEDARLRFQLATSLHLRHATRELAQARFGRHARAALHVRQHDEKTVLWPTSSPSSTCRRRSTCPWANRRSTKCASASCPSSTRTSESSARTRRGDRGSGSSRLSRMSGLTLLAPGMVFAGDFLVMNPIREGAMGAVYAVSTALDLQESRASSS